MTDTINDTAIPTIRIAACIPVKSNPNLNSFSALAPNMTGMARKNVNSAATPLDTPSMRAPTIVAPEREVPGIIASIWNTPMTSSILMLSWESFFTFGSFPF